MSGTQTTQSRQTQTDKQADHKDGHTDRREVTHRGRDRGFVCHSSVKR